MAVIDTSVWVEWVAGTALGREFTRAFENPAALVVPTLVQLELYKWSLREVGAEEAEIIVAATRACRIVTLTEPIALLAAELSRSHRLATADAIVYATARSLETTLVTIDRHFQNLPGVEYTPKGLADR